MRNLSFNELIRLGVEFVFGGRTFKRSPSYSREVMRSWQFEKIKKLVSFAYEHIPFYKEIYQSVSFHPKDLKSWEDFAKLPVVSKDDVINHFPQKMLREGSDLNQLIVSRSSGSSGKVLDIAYGQKEMILYILAGLRIFNMGFRYRPWHKQVYIYTSEYPLKSLFGLYPLHFLSTLSPREETLRALERIQPDLLVCYPSHLREIADGMSQEQLDRLHLKMISVNSEMSTQKERDYLESVFRCPVLDEYSSEELTRIAAQCLNRNHHLFEDINYIEVVDENLKPCQGVGTLLGTNLHNYAMPMIRYKQDDKGRISETDCSCGWKFRILTDFEGRKNDAFLLPSGKKLSSGFLLDATYEFLLNFRNAIRDFCLIQWAPEQITLQIVRAEGWNEAVSQKIRNRFREFLEEKVVFKIEVVGECIKTKTGKKNPIINMMNRNPVATPL